MDVSLEDFVITEPKATVTNGATSAKVVHFDMRSADEAIVTLERSKFKAYKQVVESAHRPVDLLFENSEHCIDPSESDNVSSPSEALEFCAMKCQNYSSLECTAFWLYDASATVPYRCCRRSEINLDSCREPFPGFLYSVVETSRVSIKLEAPSQAPVIFQWDEINTTIPRIELVQVLSRPVTIADAKRFALSRGLSLGGGGYGFSGGFVTSGLYVTLDLCVTVSMSCLEAVRSRISTENINREYQSRISIENVNREYQAYQPRQEYESC